MGSDATATDTSDLADQLVDEIAGSCPAYRPGTRPIHAPGITATGWFSATPVASSLTTAAHFGGHRLPVTVRFSNGTGDLDQPDSAPEVRGLAVKFHVGDVTRDEWGAMHSPVETDLISMTLPMFFAKSVESFRDFVVAATPRLPKARPRWRKLVEMLRLESPYPAPPLGTPSPDQGLFDFAACYPPASAALAWLSSNFVPESYTTCCYHAVHAFELTGPEGTTRLARFHWEPVDGVQSAPPGAKGNLLRDGLRDRISNGRPEFVLRIQVGEQGDDPSDPTSPWPARRPRVVMGHLRVTEIPEDQFHCGELLGFNPTRLLAGMSLSTDPTLYVRGEVYDRSHARRLKDARAPMPLHQR